MKVPRTLGLDRLFTLIVGVFDIFPVSGVTVWSARDFTTNGSRLTAARLQGPVHQRSCSTSLVFTGELNLESRHNLIEQFSAADMPCSSSRYARWAGIELATASYVFHFDRWWNPAVERQRKTAPSHRAATYGERLSLPRGRYHRRTHRPVATPKTALFTELIDTHRSISLVL